MAAFSALPLRLERRWTSPSARPARRRCGPAARVRSDVGSRGPPRPARCSSCMMRRSISSISTRHGVDLDPEPGSRLVDQVDGLVGQEAVGDVAVREHRGRHQRGVLDLHLVVDLVLLLEAAQDGDGVLDRGLAARGPAGSAAPARRPSRCACGTRRAWWRPRSAARRAPAPASACWRRPPRPRRRPRPPGCAARR